MRSHHIAMVTYPGMPVFEAAIPCEIFGTDRSSLSSPWYKFSILGLSDVPVRLTQGFLLAPTRAGLDLSDVDTVLIPACEDVHQRPPERLVQVVQEAHARGLRLLSLCSGAFVLAAAGVLNGRRATTHWMHADELGTRYPDVEVDAAVLYVEDGNVITSAGTVAAIDACLHVVRLDHGAAVAAEVARRMVTPPHRDGRQAQYHRPPGASASDGWLAPLLEWLDAHLHRSLVTADLAAQANVSVRTVERRFAEVLGMSPLQWLLHQRVRRAQQFLETTDRPVDWIATACGYGSTASLRSHFARLVGVSPTVYRRDFHRRAEPATIVVTESPDRRGSPAYTR